MAIRHILLGLLNYRPSTGYELKKMFDSGEHLARPHIPLSRIYPILKNFHKEGLVEFEKIERERAPDIKVYHITKRGKNVFMQWLREPIQGDRYRYIHFLEKFSFSPMLSKEETLALVDEELGFRQCLAERQKVTPFIPDDIQPTEIVDFSKAYRMVKMMEKYGSTSLQHYIEWLKKVRQEVEENW